MQAHTGAKPFTLTLTNALGKAWTFNFDLNEGMPALISGFKFTSTTSEIKLIWNPITNIGGYNVYRSDTVDGTYSKINNFLVAGSSTYTDLLVTPSTIYYYKISVVTTSGNERPLDQVVTNGNPALQGYKAWTSLDAHGAFPISALGSTNCEQVATLYDVNGDGKKEIFVNISASTGTSGQILGFKETGQEMFDIDGNPTTVSGFALSNTQMRASSAVGDIDNDGKAEVFSTGFDNENNIGKVFAYKTVDANNDSKPDTFWADGAINLGHRAITNTVLYDVDKNGFLDIIVADLEQKVYVYDKNKNLMPGWPQQVSGPDWSGGEIAVGDLDHDGKAEIALGCQAVSGVKGGIYIWHHDGTPFTVNPFKTFADNESAASAIVFADIDNDLNLDILITTKIGTNGTSGKLYAFKQNGQAINNAWNGLNTYSNVDGYAPRIAAGDLNHDGNLEIAIGGKNLLKVFDRNGVTLPNFPKAIGFSRSNSPIFADIDNDADSEILINDTGKLVAFNMDGSEVIGFPIEASNGQGFGPSPTIADIDNDGKNEIVIPTFQSTTFVYKTDGHSVNNEWSSYRGNPQNTGTYKEVCNNVVDLMTKDGTTDLGAQPNAATQYFWDSTDIWVRNNPDNGSEHQNPEYSPSNQNFAYVRVINKSCLPSTGNETMKFYWAKASTSLSWPNNWNGQNYFPAPNNTKLLGAPVGTLTIPVLQPGQETILQFPFMAPNPADYNFFADHWHFCLLSRIESASDMPIEGSDLVTNVLNNNNIAWKNVSVVDIVQNVTNATVSVGNPYNEIKTFTLELIKEQLEPGKPIYEEAEVSIKMDQTLFNAWQRGGKIAQQLDSTVDEKRKIVIGNNVLLDRITFDPKEIGMLNINFNFLTQELTEKSRFIYRVIQRDVATGKIIGGETYHIKKQARQAFLADAGGDKLVDKNLPVTISAVQISEPATYNWYDHNGTLIFTGKDLQIANAVAEKYKLEVISTFDGFKDYSEMEVKINPNRLKNVAPNPINNSTIVTYNLNEVSSAYIMIVSYYMNGGVSNNYVLDVNTTQTSINFDNYANGFYKIVLVTDGQITGTKIIFKQ